MSDEDKMRPVKIMVETASGTGEFQEYLAQDFVLFGTFLDPLQSQKEDGTVFNVMRDGEQVYKPSVSLAMSTDSSVERMLALFNWFTKKWPSVVAKYLKPEKRIIPVRVQDLHKLKIK